MVTMGDAMARQRLRHVFWVTAALSALAYLLPPVAAAPVAFWAFDEGKGSIARSLAGNCSDGRLHGTTWCEARTGSGLRFPGTDGDGCMQVDDCQTLGMETSFTVQFLWQKVSDAAQIFLGKAANDRLVTRGAGSSPGAADRDGPQATRLEMGTSETRSSACPPPGKPCTGARSGASGGSGARQSAGESWL